MFTVVISDKSGQTEKLEFDKHEVTVGRIHGNDVVLPKSNISKKHARIVHDGGRFVVVDSNSTNGTWVNGRRIDGPCDVADGGRVTIGDFTLELRDGAGESDPAVKQPAASQPAPKQPAPKRPAPPREAWGADNDLGRDWKDDWAHDDPPASASSLGAEIVELGGAAQPKRRSADATPEGAIEAAPASAAAIAPRPAPAERKAPPAKPRQAEHAPAGLGPLDELLADESVSAIAVNGASQIWVERNGKLAPTALTFSSDEAVVAALERLLAPLGKRVDPSSPVVDARLESGIRVHAVLPPVALRGPCVTIRKLGREPLRVDDLVGSGTLTPEVASFLETCVLARRNVVVSGASGSGKTATLNVLAAFIPSLERVITVEEVAELRLEQEHVVQLAARPADAEGKGAVGVRDLVRTALLLRPGRIVVGECRGAEALDVLRAMGGGPDGALTTVHAGSPREALWRLATLASTSGLDVPARAVREQIAAAVHVVVQQAHLTDGSRRVTRVCEVGAVDGDLVTTQDLFVFAQKGVDEHGRVQGRLQPTGVVPRFYDGLKELGVAADVAIFSRG